MPSVIERKWRLFDWRKIRDGVIIKQIRIFGFGQTTTPLADNAKSCHHILPVSHLLVILEYVIPRKIFYSFIWIPYQVRLLELPKISLSPKGDTCSITNLTSLSQYSCLIKISIIFRKLNLINENVSHLDWGRKGVTPSRVFQRESSFLPTLRRRARKISLLSHA